MAKKQTKGAEKILIMLPEKMADFNKAFSDLWIEADELDNTGSQNICIMLSDADTEKYGETLDELDIAINEYNHAYDSLSEAVDMINDVYKKLKGKKITLLDADLEVELEDAE